LGAGLRAAVVVIAGIGGDIFIAGQIIIIIGTVCIDIDVDIQVAAYFIIVIACVRIRVGVVTVTDCHITRWVPNRVIGCAEFTIVLGFYWFAF